MDSPDHKQKSDAATSNDITDSAVDSAVQTGAVEGGLHPTSVHATATGSATVFQAGRDVHVRHHAISPIALVSALSAVIIAGAALFGERPWSTVVITVAAEVLVVIAVRRGRPNLLGKLVAYAAVPALVATGIAIPVTRPAFVEQTEPPSSRYSLPEVRSTPSIPAAPQTALSIQDVAHVITADSIEVAVTVRNEHPGPVPINEIALYTHFDATNWIQADLIDRHFTVDERQVVGPAGPDGARRTHGMVRVGDTARELPVVGRGFTNAAGDWRRLLTFAPASEVPGRSTVRVAVEIPVRLQLLPAEAGAAELVERRFDPGVPGSLFTHVQLRTPVGAPHACAYFRTQRDDRRCDTVDPVAETKPE
ncbi:hypothetical protein [Actinokineospora globicatena]|nr:hypothetical protein [Actinokineospora globicatena]